MRSEASRSLPLHGSRLLIILNIPEKKEGCALKRRPFTQYPFSLFSSQAWARESYCLPALRLPKKKKNLEKKAAWKPASPSSPQESPRRNPGPAFYVWPWRAQRCLTWPLHPSCKHSAAFFRRDSGRGRAGASILRGRVRDGFARSVASWRVSGEHAQPVASWKNCRGDFAFYCVCILGRGREFGGPSGVLGVEWRRGRRSVIPREDFAATAPALRPSEAALCHPWESLVAGGAASFASLEFSQRNHEGVSTGRKEAEGGGNSVP